MHVRSPSAHVEGAIAKVTESLWRCTSEVVTSLQRSTAGPVNNVGTNSRDAIGRLLHALPQAAEAVDLGAGLLPQGQSPHVL